MKRGFTILELLVASMLLGMLVTILTMIFNQSAIAWRTGKAGIADLDDVRDNMAEIRAEADNVYVSKNEIRSITGLWDDQGNLRSRACDAEESQLARVLAGKVSTSKTRVPWESGNKLSAGTKGSTGKIRNYTVNVKSAGPNREFGDWDDVWSYPDEFE